MEITIIDTVKMQDFLRRTFEPLTKEKETIISCLCFSTNLLPAVQKAYTQTCNFVDMCTVFCYSCPKSLAAEMIMRSSVGEQILREQMCIDVVKDVLQVNLVGTDVKYTPSLKIFLDKPLRICVADTASKKLLLESTLPNYCIGNLDAKSGLYLNITSQTSNKSYNIKGKCKLYYNENYLIIC